MLLVSDVISFVLTYTFFINFEVSCQQNEIYWLVRFLHTFLSHLEIHNLHTDQNRVSQICDYPLVIFKQTSFSCRVSEDTALFMLKEIYRD